ncbi:MAG TPA: sigma-70 family RNA polymerase sigma factor [Chitinophagaceae bacterium]|nr:sigma-70 family RNA polymerase sigma factor [Chitinophagaceae bacterium]
MVTTLPVVFTNTGISMDDIFQSDQALLAALRGKRDTDRAIRSIYRQYFESLSIYVRQNSGSEQDAEDVFQEVVVTFIELVNQDKFRGESSIKTFLYSLNRHIWLNELKKRGRMQQRNIKFEQAKDQVESDVNELIAAREAKTQVMHVIEQLGEACKQVLIAFYYQELSMKEMLAFLPYENEQVVRNKKYKCLKKLEELLHADPILATNLKTMLAYEQ